jgi:hypothetical protein
MPAPVGCDEGGYLIRGLDINYNGVNYTDAIWSVNGTLELGQASGSTKGFINAFMPDSATPNNLLAPLWGDMFLCAGGTWSFGALASGPTAWDIFEWNAVPEWPGVGGNSFQIWLERGTSNITYTYGGTSASALFATVGAENADGTVGDTWFFDGAGADSSNGPDLGVIATPGGTATLGFQVTTDCSEDTIVNESDLSSGSANENAIAVTTCP